jgi:thiol-disulfide isomerase/thioredoxin
MRTCALIVLPLLLAGAADAAAPSRATAPGRPSPSPVVRRVPAPAVLPITADGVRDVVRRGEGRATIVNVWATWCVPCRREFPALLRAARAHRAQGVRLVLVSADFPDQLPAVRRFLAARGVTDTTWLKSGADMAFIDSLDRRWSGALPATLVYDRQGRQTAFWEGAADGPRFEQAIVQALQSTPTREESRP